jgi:hypothetical protein
MSHRRPCTWLAFAATFVLTPALQAQSVEWPFDLATTGQDVFYTSPTMVRPDAQTYLSRYTIDTVEVKVRYLGIEFGPIDVTDQIPPDQLSADGTHPGPPPFIIIDETLRFPEPPDPVTIEGDLLIEVDMFGWGSLSFTNITLGTATIDLGFPFGEQTVELTYVRIIGDVDVTPIGSLVEGDLDGDGDVDLSDLGILLAAYGVDDGGDLDGDGDTDLSDLGILLANYGFGT